MNTINKIYGERLARTLFPSLFPKVDVTQEPVNKKSLNVDSKNFLTTKCGTLHVLVQGLECKDCSLRGKLCDDNPNTRCMTGGAYKKVD